MAPRLDTTLDLLDLGPERAAIYNRISLDKHSDERAVRRQSEDAHNLARSRGWTVVGEYTDNSLSASRPEIERPEYNRLLADYRAGAFDALICFDLDRLTRQPRQLEDWIEEAEKRGLVVVTLNGEADLSTDGGRMFARVKAAVARSEIERKSARHKRANVQRAENGHWQFSRRPYGYDRINGEIVIVEPEAEIVRECYRRYNAGESLYAIANDLNERGIPLHSADAEWSMRRVQQMLRNERYAGIVSHLGKRYDAEPSWEPLIDKRTWRDYVKTREARTREGAWSTTTKHLLSGMIFCGVCGARLLARPDYRRNPDGSRRTFQAYACQENWCVQIKAEEVEPVVNGIVLARLADKRVLKGLREEPNTAPVVEEIRKLRERHSNLVDLVADGALPRAEARQRGQALAEKVARLEKRLNAMRHESPLTDLALSRAIPTKWNRKMSIMEKRRVIEELGLIVTIDKARRGRRPNGPEGKPLPDLDRIRFEWRDATDAEAPAS